MTSWSGPSLRGYDDREKYVMTIKRLKQIHGAFHPESGKYLYEGKCHQLRYFIRMFIDK